MNDSTKPKDSTSYKETAFGIIPRDELLMKEAEGIAKGIEYILSASKSLPIGSDFLLQLHKACFGWIFPTWAGKYRKINVQTSSHTFPNHTDVQVLVRDFFGDLNERLRHDFEAIELIAWAHHRIVWIHPFKDYNGRTARLFSNYLMLLCSLPLAEIQVESEEERKQYIAALKAADNGDFSSLEKLIKRSINSEE